jgi:predicted SnoaL-like aldol condensation-catalyzing enzyme
MKIVTLHLVVAFALGCSSGKSEQSLRANKALVVRTHSDVWSRGDMKAADEIYATDFVAHWTGGPDTTGLENFKAFVADGRRRAPDLREEVEQVVAEGDLVVTRFTSRGTFASAPGEPSKRKDATMREIAIHRISHGKIVEQWTVGGLLRIQHLVDSPNDGGRD